MDYVLSKKYDETFTINFIGTEELSYQSGTTTLHLEIDEPIDGVSKIDNIDYRVDGTIDEYQYLELYFKYKNAEDDNIPCDSCWSDMLEISKLSGLTLNPNQPFYFELFVFRVDNPSNNKTSIWISNIVISGTYEIEKTDGIVTITKDNNQIILSPKDIYKVFSVENFDVIMRGNINNVDIKFRVTQNNGRTYSQWEQLTVDNISTFRFNELRFAKVEYLITQINESPDPTVIYDIILEGDFQNVSANYLKNNRYGLREDCLSNFYKENGDGAFSCGIPNYSNNNNGDNTGSSGGNGNSNVYNLKMDFYTQGLSCYIHSTTTKEVDMENKDNQEGMWNPYETDKITDLANKIANDINSIFAWKVDYHLTDPDEGGTDMTLHEYQLYNIIDVKNIRILVPDNKFPDNTVKMNKFNLDLFDVFEIHILKDEFKNHFGIDKRPAENDIVFFCELNRLYRVKHAQVFREVMNAGIYWKVILEKYEQKANIRNLSEESKAKIDKLTRNTTIDELFGQENKEESEKIANKSQTKPLTHDDMRHTIYKNVIIYNESLYNGNINFADYYYDLKDTSGKKSVVYRKTDNNLNKSQNRAFITWFNFNNKYSEDPLTNRDSYKYYDISTTKNFNLLNNFNESTKKGYRYWYHKNKITFQLNNEYYQMNVNLKTNIWYGLVMNLNQRQQSLDMKLYKRPGYYNIKMINPDTFELATVPSYDLTGYTYLISVGFKPNDNQEVHDISTEFKLLHQKTFDNVYPTDFSHDMQPELIGSDIKYTNLRIFNDVIPDDNINNVLNQLIIVDEDRLILADNANRRMYADNFPTNRWD